MMNVKSLLVAVLCILQVCLGSAQDTSFFGYARPIRAGQTYSNVTLNSSIRASSINVTFVNATAVAGTAILDMNGSGLLLSVKFAWANATFWGFAVYPSGLPKFSPEMLNLVLDPNLFTGSLSRRGNVVTSGIKYFPFELKVGSVSITQGTLTFSNQCPFRNNTKQPDMTKCPTPTNATAPALYASLTGAIINNKGRVTGGFSLNAGAFESSSQWVRLEGTGLNPINAGVVTITDPQMVVWSGARQDAFDEAMVLPDVSAATSGYGIEFCGGFSIEIPNLVNLAKSGCARPTPQGFVVAQNGITNGLGTAWTSMTSFMNGSLPSVSFNGVAKQLISNTKTVSGTWPVPDKLAQELGVTQAVTTCDVTGTAGQSGLELGGICLANIALGTEPLKLSVSSLDITLVVTTDTWTFSGGTSISATFGWAPLAVSIPMSFTISSNSTSDGATAGTDAGGTSSESVDGDTAATALKTPQDAKFIWPNAFGITGLNLWAMTTNFKLNGLTTAPAVGFQIINYLDPTKFKGVLTGTDWMFSSLSLSNQQTTPCFAFGFDGSTGNSKVSIKDVLLASKFGVGVAKSSCKIGSLNLPAGFSGLVFQSTLGGGSFNIQLQRSGTTTFAGTASVKNVALSGVQYPNVLLTVNVRQDANGNIQSQTVQFTGDMSTEVGTFASTVSLDKQTNGLKQSLTVSGADMDFSSASGGFELQSISFTTAIDAPSSGCASWMAAFSGSVKMKETTYTVNKASLAFSCGTLTSFIFSMSISHYEKFSKKTNTATLSIIYYSKSGSSINYVGTMSGDKFRGEQKEYDYTKALIGIVALTSERHFRDKYQSRTFSRNVKLGIVFGFGVYQTSASTSKWNYAIGAGGTQPSWPNRSP
jgi:hypothetical protein